MTPLKVRHKVLRRGDSKIVINYVKKTGAIIDAGLYRNDELIEVTDDTDKIKQWSVDE